MGSAAVSGCAIVVPVHNEERAIASTLDRLRAAIRACPDVRCQLICVDDGSIDGTGVILDAQPDVSVVRHAANRGYGAALRTGIRHAAEPWILIVDADGTYPIEDVPRFFAAATDCDMVVGARYGVGVTSGRIRQVALASLRGLVALLTRKRVPDLNSGMRLFRRPVFEAFESLLPDGFSFTTTVTVSSLFVGARLRFIPIEYSRRIGLSHIKPLRDFGRFVRLILRLTSHFAPMRLAVPVTTACLGLATGFLLAGAPKSSIPVLLLAAVALRAGLRRVGKAARHRKAAQVMLQSVP